MNTILRLAAAAVLATPLVLSTIATASSSAPPPPSDRGLLSGPDVDKGAAEGRRAFGPGSEQMAPGDRGERRERRLRGQNGAMRRFAMLAMAIRDAEPTPEQATAIRTYLGEVRSKAQAFAEANGEEMRKLVRVRRELVADGGDLSEVDAEIVALRSRFMKPGEILENVQKQLDPEQRERFRASLEGQIRAAMERMRQGGRGEMAPDGERPMEPRRRGGRPDGPAMDGPEGAGDGRGGRRPAPIFQGTIEEVFESELLLEAMRGDARGDRSGGREGQRRRGENRPPLDLDTPPTQD